MREEKWIWLDMDGTIADLYARATWLEELRAYDPTPYKVAKLMYDINELLPLLWELKCNGYNLGIISWLSKEPNPIYDELVTRAKREWLEENYLDIILDKILITPYGVKKADTCRKFGYGILIDDEKQNRDAWDLGETINAKENILEMLKHLLDN